MITCPACHTTFLPETLGLTDLLTQPSIIFTADVQCPTCVKTIHAEITHSIATQRTVRHPLTKSTVRKLTVKVRPTE